MSENTQIVVQKQVLIEIMAQYAVSTLLLTRRRDISELCTSMALHGLCYGMSQEDIDGIGKEIEQSVQSVASDYNHATDILKFITDLKDVNTPDDLL